MIELFSTMSWWQIAMACAAVPLAGAFLCRLTYGEGPIWHHVKTRYVLLHFSGFVFCGTVIFLRPEGVEVVGLALGLVVCGLLIWTTYPTWAGGEPPAYALRDPLRNGDSRLAAANVAFIEEPQRKTRHRN